MAEEEETKIEKEDKVVDNSKPIVEEKSKIEDKKEKSKLTTAKKVSKKKNDEPKVEIEREYIVPLRKGFLNVPHYRRAKKAVKTLKEFMVRHMKIRDGDTRKVKVNIHLNNEIWFRGIRKPLNKIKVKAKKIEDIVYVELADIPEVVKFKIAREEKRKSSVGKKKEKKKEETKKEKVEEKEDEKAEKEASVKMAKEKVKSTKHTAQGKHKAKTTPVRKVLK